MLGREVHEFSVARSCADPSVDEVPQESGQRGRRKPRPDARDSRICQSGKDRESANRGEEQMGRQAGTRGEGWERGAGGGGRDAHVPTVTQGRKRVMRPFSLITLWSLSNLAKTFFPVIILSIGDGMTR